MIGRVSQVFIKDKYDYNLATRQSELSKVENQLASGFRVNLPSDDPVAVVNFIDYQSRIKEIDVYKNMSLSAKDKINVIDSALDSGVNILHRLRELAVQAANGVYTNEDRIMIATESDQLLRELISISNQTFKSVPLFAGTAIDQKPFRQDVERDSLTGKEFIKSVRYIGNSQDQVTEIDRDEKIESNISGNKIFWSDNMQLTSKTNISGYSAPVDSEIIIDGKNIQISAGDNIDMIAKKINDSGVAVRAEIITKDGESIITLATTTPHQIELEDIKGGSVLSDFGLIVKGAVSPDNYSPTAEVYTGSIFEAIIDFRKSLISDNTERIGSEILSRMDNSLINMLNYRARLGAVSERIDILNERFSADEIYLTDAKDRAVSTDIPKAMTDLKMLEFSHDVALNIGSRLMPKTLLDFLR